MFENLTDQFEKVKRKIFGWGRITERELAEFLNDLKITLLEADVHYRVVKDFIDRIEARARGLKISDSLHPADLLLKTVYEEMINLLGEKPCLLKFTRSISVISLIGLQGTGKTTTAVKLANHFRNQRPLLVAADTKRPAAREQLKILGSKANIPIFETEELNPVLICGQAVEKARSNNLGLVIIDTAGRLHIDDELIDELIKIRETVKPDWQIIVTDGMTGQDAVKQAQEFHSRLNLSGVIMTKLDGDSRGGAALSIVAITSLPLLFIGTGEKIEDFEEFHPDRIASRILGMGDIKTLTEKISTIGLESSPQQIKKIKKGEFNLEDFRLQLQQIKRLGPLSKLASMIPGVKADDFDENEIVRVEAIINSMTREERNHPEIIDGSRKKRIALGSGTDVSDVNQLLKQFFLAKDMMKHLSSGKMPLSGRFNITKQKYRGAK